MPALGTSKGTKMDLPVNECWDCAPSFKVCLFVIGIGLAALFLSAACAFLVPKKYRLIPMAAYAATALWYTVGTAGILNRGISWPGYVAGQNIYEPSSYGLFPFHADAILAPHKNLCTVWGSGSCPRQW